MTVEMHIASPAAERLARAWRDARGLVIEEMTAAIFEGTQLLEREVKERTPVGATSALRSSISAGRPEPLPEGVIGVVGTSLRHAVPVELGRRPGKRMPPIAPLADWAVSKLGVPEGEAQGIAFLIARKIAAKGTEGAKMFERGMQASEARIQGMMEAAAKRIAGRLAEARA